MRKTIWLLLAVAAAFIIGGFLFLIAFWNGTFNFLLPREIAAYNSPDGEYSLVFEQMGDPAWPFGATDVRLTLKDRHGKVMNRISTQIHDDGANAGEHHVVAVSWHSDAVVVVLRGSEMQDQEVAIPFHRR